MTKPNDKHRKALQAIADLEDGGDAVLNREVAEECCTSGWLEPISGLPGYRLTQEGLRQLEPQ